MDLFGQWKNLRGSSTGWLWTYEEVVLLGIPAGVEIAQSISSLQLQHTGMGVWHDSLPAVHAKETVRSQSLRRCGENRSVGKRTPATAKMQPSKQGARGRDLTHRVTHCIFVGTLVFSISFTQATMAVKSKACWAYLLVGCWPSDVITIAVEATRLLAALHSYVLLDKQGAC